MEALAAQVQVVFPANWICLKLELRLVSLRHLMSPWPLLQALHFLDPAPNFRGLENQILSWPILALAVTL